MRRNLGSEVLIAIGAFSVIICALFFAVLLSTSSGSPQATNIPSSLVTSVAQSNTDDNPTESALSPTDEPTVTDTNESLSETPIDESTSASSKPTAFEENIEEVLTDTPEPTATDTEIPIDTDTPEPTTTDTEIPIDTDTLEPTATDTEISIDTNTPEPTATHTERPSATPEPSNTPEPTATQTASNTPRPTATNTSVNAYTGIIPTLPPSPTVIPIDAPTRTPSSCQLPQGWTTYIVQSGDTLFAISLATNSTVDELRFANCIDDIDNITAGDRIFVPIAPVRPVATIVPSGIRQGLAAVGCTSPATQITSPITAQRVSGRFTLYGTATRPDFQYYKIEIRPDFANIYNFYSDSQTQVVNGVLGQINADLFGEGLHWIRLSVVDIRANIPSDAICEIPVIFE